MRRIKGLTTLILARLFASVMFTDLPKHFPVFSIWPICVFFLFYYQGEYQAALDIYDEEVKKHPFENLNFMMIFHFLSVLRSHAILKEKKRKKTQVFEVKFEIWSRK